MYLVTQAVTQCKQAMLILKLISKGLKNTLTDQTTSAHIWKLKFTPKLSRFPVDLPGPGWPLGSHWVGQQHVSTPCEWRAPFTPVTSSLNRRDLWMLIFKRQSVIHKPHMGQACVSHCSFYWETSMQDTTWSSGHCFIFTAVAKTSRLATKEIIWRKHSAIPKEKKETNITATTTDVAFYALFRKTDLKGMHSFISVWENMLNFKYIASVLIGGPVFIQYIWSFKKRKKKDQEKRKYQNLFELISYT